MNLTRQQKQKVSVVDLNTASLSRWDKLFRSAKNATIFQSPGWLAAYLDKQSLKVLFINKGGIDIAGYVLPSSGKPIYKMKLNGPLIRQPKQYMKPSTLYEYEKAIYKEIASYIISEHTFYCDFWDYNFKFWYPLMWSGFQQTLHYHLHLDISDTQTCWDNLSTKIRTDIRKAEKYDSSVECLDFGEFVKRHPNISFGNAKSMIFYSHLNKSLPLYINYNTINQEMASGILLAYDFHSTYYIDSFNFQKSTGTQSYLIWDTICNSKTTSFNFLGSKVPAVESFFRGFGSTPVPYLCIKYNKPLKYIKTCSQTLKNLFK